MFFFNSLMSSIQATFTFGEMMSEFIFYFRSFSEVDIFKNIPNIASTVQIMITNQSFYIHTYIHTL